MATRPYPGKGRKQRTLRRSPFRAAWRLRRPSPMRLPPPSHRLSRRKPTLLASPSRRPATLIPMRLLFSGQSSFMARPAALLALTLLPTPADYGDRALGSLQATPLKRRLPKHHLCFVGEYLGVAVRERAAKRLKGHSRVANLYGLSHGLMARVEQKGKSRKVVSSILHTRRHRDTFCSSEAGMRREGDHNFWWP